MKPRLCEPPASHYAHYLSLASAFYVQADSATRFARTGEM